METHPKIRIWLMGIKMGAAAKPQALHLGLEILYGAAAAVVHPLITQPQELHHLVGMVDLAEQPELLERSQVVAGAVEPVETLALAALVKSS